MDKNGVTALIESALRLTPSNFHESFCLDVMLHPSAISGDAGLRVFNSLLKTYMALGGMAVQFNIFNAGMLRAAQVTDMFLYDIKAIEESVHIKCTGQSNRLILENLKYIDAAGKKTEIRYPYVLGYNSGEAESIAEFVSSLKNVTGVRVLPYHNYAGSKYLSLGMKNTLPDKLLDSEEIENIKRLFKS